MKTYITTFLSAILRSAALSGAVIAETKTPEISRAQFTSAIVDHEPTDELKTVPPTLEDIYYFSEMKNYEGKTLTHVWEKDGKEIHRISFDVKAPRWRVYSSKKNKIGDTNWKVSILDGDTLLRSDSIEVSKDHSEDETGKITLSSSPLPEKKKRTLTSSESVNDGI